MELQGRRLRGQAGASHQTEAEDQGRSHSQAGFGKEPLMVMVKCLPWGRGDYQGIIFIEHRIGQRV